MHNKFIFPLLGGIVIAFLLGYVLGQKEFFSQDVPVQEAQNIQQDTSSPAPNWKEALVENVKSWEFNDHPATEWKTYTNDEYGFTLQYPAHFNYDENTIDHVDQLLYNINFGLPYEQVFKKPHENQDATSSLQVIIRKKSELTLEGVIAEGKKTRGHFMKHTVEKGATRKIAGFSAKQVTVCDPNDVCSDIYYFATKEYIYEIADNSIVGKKMDRINFEKMISTFQLK